MGLGRLQKIELRDVWANEAGDFTPWLAREENLVLLGDTIGIDLELEAQEKHVGPFRADILCKDTSNGRWVLVENQLERTDHTHLGQLITYAAGLSAVTIVWIAQRFTPEHRAAIDWFNEITGDDLNFFGLEVELWKIGDSLSAPRFNIISQPNDWTKGAVGGRRIIDRDLTTTQEVQLEFWTGLKNIILDRGSVLKPQKPLPQGWTVLAIGRSEFNLGVVMNIRDSWVRAELNILGDRRARYFGLLIQDRSVIESELGFGLEWNERSDKKNCQLSICKREVSLAKKDDWAANHIWLADRLERMHIVFANRIRNLDPNDFGAGPQV